MIVKMLSETKCRFTTLSENKKIFTLPVTETGPEAFASPSWNSLFLY